MTSLGFESSPKTKACLTRDKQALATSVQVRSHIRSERERIAEQSLRFEDFASFELTKRDQQPLSKLQQPAEVRSRKRRELLSFRPQGNRIRCRGV